MVPEELMPVVEKSIKALSSVCDHAQSRDTVGFSKATAGPGHEIAALGTQLWNEQIWNYALRLSAHHGRQLGKIGILSADEVDKLQIFAQGRIKAPHIQTDWATTDVIEGRKFVVLSIQNTEENNPLKQVLKRLPKQDVYQPAGGGRLWRIAEKYALVINDILPSLTIMNEEVNTLVSNALATATAETKLEVHFGPLLQFYENRTGVYFIAPYDPTLANATKGNLSTFWQKGKNWQEITYAAMLDADGANFLELVLKDYNGAAQQDILDAIKTAHQKKSNHPEELILECAMERLGDRIRISLNRYDRTVVDVIKSVPGRAWVQDGNVWSIPAREAHLQYLKEQAFHTQGAAYLVAPAEEMLEALKSGLYDTNNADLSGNKLYPTISVRENENGDKAVISMSTYVQEWVDIIKKLPRDERTYIGAAWEIENTSETFTRLLASFISLSANMKFEDGRGRDAVKVLDEHLAKLQYSATHKPF